MRRFIKRFQHRAPIRKINIASAARRSDMPAQLFDRSLDAYCRVAEAKDE